MAHLVSVGFNHGLRIRCNVVFLFFLESFDESLLARLDLGMRIIFLIIGRSLFPYCVQLLLLLLTRRIHPTRLDLFLYLLLNFTS